ncbi:MAG: hypothetical protein FWG81_00820 [Betaproteobacteria bacterium]|nr:hypothetical protein [Betaproteobacteria bacterium]
MRFVILCLSCLCLILSGCATPAQTEETEPAIPVPTQFPVSAQFRLEAGRHWQSIAEDAARALVFGMRGQRCGPGRNCRPLYVLASETETTFSRAFTNALITALVTQNVTVTNTPDNALTLNIDVQSLKFGYGDKLEPDQKVRPLMPNLWVATPEPRETNPNLVHLFPSRAAHCEIFVTLSVLDGARYVARNSQTYYISAHDLRLYEQRICSRLNPCEGGITKGSISIVGDPQKPDSQKPNQEK